MLSSLAGAASADFQSTDQIYEDQHQAPTVADADYKLRGGLVLPHSHLHSFSLFFFIFFLFSSHFSPLISMEVRDSRGARVPCKSAPDRQ